MAAHIVRQDIHPCHVPGKIRLAAEEGVVQVGEVLGIAPVPVYILFAQEEASGYCASAVHRTVEHTEPIYEAGAVRAAKQADII